MRTPNRPLKRSERSNGSVGVVVGGSSGTAGLLSLSTVTVASWTSSAGRYYYDLVHNRVRQGLLMQLVDTHTGEYFWADQITSTSNDTVRIWLSTDPGANRVDIYYI
jgi:hypothetical protein